MMPFIGWVRCFSQQERRHNRYYRIWQENNGAFVFGDLQEAKEYTVLPVRPFLKALHWYNKAVPTNTCNIKISVTSTRSAEHEEIKNN